MTVPLPCSRIHQQYDESRQGVGDALGGQQPEPANTNTAIASVSPPLHSSSALIPTTTRQSLPALSSPQRVAFVKSEQINDAHNWVLRTAQLLSNSVDRFQDELDYLVSEWHTIQIVFESMRNAYEAAMLKEAENNSTNNHRRATDWVEIDKELSVSYDDLMAQVRQLDRRLKRLTVDIKQTLSSYLIEDE